MTIIKYLYKTFVFLLSPVYLTFLFLTAIIVRIRFDKHDSKPKFVWGPEPLVNNVYWSRALKEAGYPSETFTKNFISALHQREIWDVLIQEKYKIIPIIPLRYFVAFIDSLMRYDIFVVPFTGYFLGLTPLWWFEAFILKIAKKHVVVIPYGSDSYVYRNIRSTGTLLGLMMSYPLASRNQEKLLKKVAYWCRHADVVIPNFMGPDGFGRWDVIIPNNLIIDLLEWSPSRRQSDADGKNETVFIAHAPNHRGCKGTEFISAAVEKLAGEGLKVELLLLENVKNTVVKETLQTKADILIEQLIITGHGFNAIEGMASALPVISNLEDDTYTLPLRRWSYLAECPLVSGTPETIATVLRKLVTRPGLRHQLGKAGREYVQKFHAFESAQFLFGQIIDYLDGRRDSLVNLYHPILGEYKKEAPRIKHPLVKNRIVD